MKPELPPNYTVVDLRKARADGGPNPWRDAYELENNVRPFQVLFAGDLIDEIVQRPGGSYFAERSEAVEVCWAHWREHGDPAWVDYLGALPSEDEVREPFDGFEDVSDEHRKDAQSIADRFEAVFESAGLLAPTSDDAIFGAQLQMFADQATNEPGAKGTKLVRAIFSDKTAQGQACSLMLAQLLKRLYSAPYPGLNTAGLDFVNVFVSVVDTAYRGLKTTPKFGSKAKGKRPA